jgi:2-oxo-4-hydroxy-4-carboxy-5-ureidoimidazoline decarboxylase
MTLHDFNTLPVSELTDILRKCCGSNTWVNKMLPHVPAEDMVELLEDAEIEWWNCSESDWKEAFATHPKIGAKKFGSADPDANGWASKEQGTVRQALPETLEALAEANKLYKEKFGYIFIVCATGKSAEEMLGILHSRLHNSPEEEIKVAADEQNMITKLRLEKLLDIEHN